MIDNLSDRVKEVFFNSEQLARRKKHMYLEPAHVALSIMDQPSKNIENLLKDVGFNFNALSNNLIAS